jgi:hypothetical protein
MQYTQWQHGQQTEYAQQKHRLNCRKRRVKEQLAGRGLKVLEVTEFKGQQILLKRSPLSEFGDAFTLLWST